MPEVEVVETKDIKVKLHHPVTGEYLGSISIDVKDSWYKPEECDGYTKKECKVLEHHRDVYCWAQKAHGVPYTPKVTVEEIKG